MHALSPEPDPRRRSTRRGPKLPRPRSSRVTAAVALLVLLATAWAIGRPSVRSDSSSSDRGGLTKSAQLNSVAPDVAGGEADSAAPGAPDVATSASGGAAAGSTAADSTRDRGAAYDAKAPSSALDGAKIIRTGSATVVVKRGTFDEAVARLTSMATGLGGYVSGSERSAIDGHPQGTITLRVPANEFDRVTGELDRIGEVTSSNTSSQDVTGEYTDVAAHITALKAEREQILLVLDKANTVPDILSVRDRLNAVQVELDQLQGRKQVLDDQTSLATLTVSLREKGSAAASTVPAEERRGLSKVWHDSTDRFLDGARAIALGLATLAPWLLLAALLYLPYRAWSRREERAGTPPAAGPPATVTD